MDPIEISVDVDFKKRGGATRHLWFNTFKTKLAKIKSIDEDAEPAVKRLGWVGSDSTLAMRVQCRLAGVSRATVYARRTPQIAGEVELLLCPPDR